MWTAGLLKIRLSRLAWRVFAEVGFCFHCPTSESASRPFHMKRDDVYAFPGRMGWLRYDCSTYFARRRAGFPNDYPQQVFDAPHA